MIENPNARPLAKLPWPERNSFNIGDNYAEGEQIRVRCIHPKGVYYNHHLWKENDVFTLMPQFITVLDREGDVVKENGKPKMKVVTAREQFSDKTMEMVDPSTPEHHTSAQQSLDNKQEEINSMKRGPGRPRKEQPLEG